MLQAWHIATIPNTNGVKLKDLLIADEAAPRRKSWRDLKAVLLFAMPPKGNA